ncbi:uncharacterized protein [Elaeis guineensis]|uniref:uncharacterized protein n=1 Tax=Elaeis guineensis var. tenera TaxID=51953 RepID=UPI003C6D982D
MANPITMQGLEGLLDRLITVATRSRGSSRDSGSLNALQVAVKLDGPTTYLQWERSTRLLVQERGLEGYLTGTKKKPTNNEQDMAQWRMENSIVLAFLLNTMTPNVARSVQLLETAQEVWETVAQMFSQKQNSAQAFEIRSQLCQLRQGDLSITEYATELKQEERVQDFLYGLNPEYESVRVQLLTRDILPSLGQVFSTVLSEETRRRVTSDSNSSIRSTLTVQPQQVGEKVCFHCKKPGHIKAFCWDLHGRPNQPGRGSRGCDGRRSGGRTGGQNHVRGPAQANLSEETEGAIHSLSTEEYQTFRRMMEKYESSSNTTPSTLKQSSHQDEYLDSSLFAHSSTSYKLSHAFTCGTSNSWVIDSGASSHMTGAPNSFISYSPCSGHNKVRIADGSFTPVSGKGSIDCTPNLRLSSVLHIPSFPTNLLSISSVTRDLNCSVTFWPSHCLFQEQRTGKILGGGRMHNGLYYLSTDEKSMSSSLMGYALSAEGGTSELMLHHRRLGHIPFSILSRLFPSLSAKCNKNLLVCDHCELAKHTRAVFPISGIRSSQPFALIHSDVWGPCSTNTLKGHRWFVTFIDCFSRGTRSIVPPARYRYDITNYVSYKNVSSSYQSFIAALDSVCIPSTWQKAMAEPKWKEAMLEEMTALSKNQTWDLVTLPAGKHPVGCKCVYTIKQTPEGKLDVKNAFLHGDLQEEVYMQIPPGFETRATIGKVCKLKRSLYGLKQSPRSWFDRFSRTVKGMGYKQSNADDTLFYRHLKGKKTILLVYVDDINHRTVTDGGTPVDRERYQRLVGRLIYLSHTRPDIAYAVSVISQYMHDPRESHMERAFRVLRYLKGCPGHGLLFSQHNTFLVEGFTDADWAGSLDDRQSTSGYCTYVGDNLVTWRSKKQSVVARSSAEAEYRVMALGICELLWLQKLLQELQLLNKFPLRLYCDNKAAIEIVSNPIQHDRTKYIEIDRHFIKEKINQGQICITYIRSSDQVADILTKGLSSLSFSGLTDKMGLRDIFASS